MDDGDATPVSRLTLPTQWILRAGGLVKVAALGEQGHVEASMALRRGDEADRAVPVLVVVPVHQRCDPTTRVQEICKGLSGSCGRYFSVRNRDSE